MIEEKPVGGPPSSRNQIGSLWGMFLIKPSDGPNLTPEQVRQLDDEFFSARPLAYFSTRVQSLLGSWDTVDEPTPATTEFFDALGLPHTSTMLDISNENDRKLQVAVDSFALRHHTAEALARLLLAVGVSRDAVPAVSTWATITDGPTTLHAVATKLSKLLNADEYLLSRAFFLPGVKDDEQTRAALRNAFAWVRRSLQLLTDNDLTVNAAHNKVKHGLAVSARNDVRVELLNDVELDEDGNLPLSAFSNSTPLFDRPSLAYMARPYPAHAQGLEVSSLLIDPPLVLAEAWMIAVIHAAIFHVAARNHFGNEDTEIAPYPALHLHPTPDDLLGNRVHGFRAILTTPLNSSATPRDSGLFAGTTFTPITLDFDGVIHTTVVEG